MYSGTQLHYLKAMGIPAWESRDSVRSVLCASPLVEDSPSQSPSPATWLQTQTLQQLGGKPEPLYALGPANSSLLVLSDPAAQPSDQPLSQPFFGAAGKLLDAMLKAIGQSRTSCQLAALAPAGSSGTYGLDAWAAQHSPTVILYCVHPNSDKSAPLTPGSSGEEPVLAVAGAQCVVSYHPEFLLQHPEMKRRAWEDLKTVRRLLD